MSEPHAPNCICTECFRARQHKYNTSMQNIYPDPYRDQQAFAANALSAAAAKERLDGTRIPPLTATVEDPAARRRGLLLPSASDLRKTLPLASGCFDYFPAALAAVAELSHWGNEKHNPGEPLHDARDKSTDDADCLLRHFMERGKLDEITVGGKQVKVRHSTAVAWRALRLLQKELEAAGAPLAPGAKL